MSLIDDIRKDREAGTPSNLVKRLELYERVWGDLPSIAPHLETAPGITTGKVISDMADARSHILDMEAALLAAEDNADKYQRWLMHEWEICVAAGDRAGEIAYQRALAAYRKATEGTT